ncbi:hypothetical protein [Massilia pseudoviolaceinigra]|uniref:hypothetical protein n=1 Tax=Massilia pseudoviolaceinigra TaxID=3057165 RepID=UPI0027964D45|nr:hypothetical protein [Massilia sp. CCM 9206]MDQ1919744.1 hypothetical protein [Massilia sp. CCM 9206]
MKKSLFDPHTSLLELEIIRVTGGILLLVIIFSIGAIVFNGDFFWKLDYTGFNFAIEAFRVPIGVAALSIPIMAILAANHRSEQSREQMRLTSLQNIFANHYKHVEEFEKYCIRHFDRMLDDDKSTREFYEKSGGVMKFMASESFIHTHVDPQHSRLLHKLIYPYSAAGDFGMSRDFIKSLDSFVSEMIEGFQGFGSENKADWYFPIEKLNQIVIEYSEKNYVNLHRVSGTKNLNINDIEIAIPGGDVMNFVRRVQDVIYALEQVLSFDISYIPSSLVKKVGRANFNELPSWDVDSASDWKSVNVSTFLAATSHV